MDRRRMQPQLDFLGAPAIDSADKCFKAGRARLNRHRRCGFDGNGAGGIGDKPARACGEQRARDGAALAVDDPHAERFGPRRQRQE